MNSKKTLALILLCIGIGVTMLANNIATVYGIPTTNSWYAVIVLWFFIACISTSGILYSIEIKQKKRKLCYAIRFFVLFANLVNITATIKMLMESNIR